MWLYGSLTNLCVCVYREWADISLAAEKLKQGAFFLSTSHVLKSALFEVVKSLNFKMSWGSATLYVHVRVLAFCFGFLIVGHCR